MVIKGLAVRKSVLYNKENAKPTRKFSRDSNKHNDEFVAGFKFNPTERTLNLRRLDPFTT